MTWTPRLGTPTETARVLEPTGVGDVGVQGENVLERGRERKREKGKEI